MKKKLMKEGYGWRQTGLFSFTKDYVEKNFDFVKDTVEEWEDEKKRRKIDKWAKEITEFLSDDEDGTLHYMLDDRLALFAGWMKDDDGEYAPVIGIKDSWSDDMMTDFEWMSSPVVNEYGDVMEDTMWITHYDVTYKNVKNEIQYLLKKYDELMEEVNKMVDDIENENLEENKNMKKANLKEALVKKMIAKKLRESKMNRKNKKLVKESSDYSTFYHVFGNYTTDNFHRLVKDMIENVEAEDINEDNLYDVIRDEIDTRLIYYDDQWEVLKHYYYPNEIDIFNDAIDKLADDMEKCVKKYWDEKDEDSEELEEESKKIVKEEKGQESYDARSIAEDIFHDITWNMPKSEDIEEDLERRVSETLDNYFIYSGDIKEMCKEYASRELEKYGLSKAKNIAYENAFGEIMHRLERLVDKWNMEAEEYKEKDEDDEIEDIKKESKESKKSEPRITIRNIEWDTDDEDVDLPKKVEVSVKELGIDEDTNEDEIVDIISDYLSNEYEWLPISFKYVKK